MRCIILAVNTMIGNLECAVNQKIAQYWLIRFTVNFAYDEQRFSQPIPLCLYLQ
jgi:hypothetical protein